MCRMFSSCLKTERFEGRLLQEKVIAKIDTRKGVGED